MCLLVEMRTHSDNHLGLSAELTVSEMLLKSNDSQLNQFNPKPFVQFCLTQGNSLSSSCNDITKEMWVRGEEASHNLVSILKV